MAAKKHALKSSPFGTLRSEGTAMVFLSPGVLCGLMREDLLHPSLPAIALAIRLQDVPQENRKVTFRLYPNVAEIAALNKSAAAHCKIYNTLLETSRLRFKAGLTAYTRTSVCEDVKRIRNAHRWIEDATTAQSAQVTGQRLVLAFQNFFDRVAKGFTPGYPRFKSAKKYLGWGYKTFGDGWSLLDQKSKTNAAGHTKHSYSAVRLSGIGTVGLRGAARFIGIPTTAEVTRKAGKWYLSVTMAVTPEAIARKGGNESMAFDWGLTTLLTQVIGEPMHGKVEEVQNPRWLKKQLEKLVSIQQDISRLETAAKAVAGKAKRFAVGHQLKVAYQRRRSLHGKVLRQRKDFYDQLTARLVARFGLIVTEELAIANMTRSPSPKPDPDNAGQFLPNGAASKAGLNRSILDAAPAGFIAKLQCKATEAGTKMQFIPTRKVKPTQRCHLCGQTTKLELKDRQWTCACGAHHHRDENAARTMLRYAYEGEWWKQDSKESGQELPGCRKVSRNSLKAQA